MKLNRSEVVFHPLSGVEARAHLFWWRGGLYRAIRNVHISFYEHLLSTGIIRNLVRRKLLVETEATDLELDGYGLVLKHQTVPFVSYCYEWCGEMLKAAALSVLELETELLNDGVALVDLKPHNVLFVGTTPVWVDLGALCPLSDWESIGQPYETFSAYFTRPLKIMAAGHSRIARCLLRDGNPGIEQREVQAIAGTESDEVIGTAKAGAKKIIPSPLHPFVRRVAQHLAHSLSSEAVPEPINIVKRAARDIEKICLVQPLRECSVHNGRAVFPDFTSTVDWTDKRRSILSVLSAKKPGSVLDTGSDRGWYAQLAARNGARVISVGLNEAAVARLFSDAVAKALPILPLIIDLRKINTLTAMTDAPSLTPAQRLRCDMVLALGPIQHLAFTASHFNLMVSHLSAFARKWLVIEFVARDDPHVEGWPDVRSSGYALDTLLALLTKEFKTIELFPSDSEKNRILLCER